MSGWRADGERGFTLTELLVAITILGIIIIAIGAMITTAFRTSSIVRAELDGSRAPKQVSFYWVPDVEGATDVEIGGGANNCGGNGQPIVTFAWTKYAVVTGGDPATPPPEDPGTAASATWKIRPRGQRTQVVREECLNGAVVASATVVPDLATGQDPGVVKVGDDEYRFHAVVPDTSRPDKTFDFTVGAVQEHTP